jgi:predicted TIM-barrel fold metal-dependent hydrolase
VQDDQIPAFWQRLGTPGLVDIHVHFMPMPVLRKVWAYFDNAVENYGFAWPVQYRGTDEERLATLRAFGVRRFPSLLYPHKPGMAAWLNEWAADFARAHDDVAMTGTFYPEPDASAYVAKQLGAGAQIFKVHVQVGHYDPRDALLDDVWGQLADAAVPVIVHCGTGPIRGEHTGASIFGGVLERHPSLTAVIAHFGMYQYEQHLELAEKYDNVHLDTTMVGTDFVEALSPVPRGLLPRYRALKDKVVLGTDFPNIPYNYGQQLGALERFGFGDDWLRAVCWDNGARLLQVTA